MKETKENCLERQDELLDRFVGNLEKRGTKVFLATDAQAAIDHILTIARDVGAKTVSKSKSAISPLPSTRVAVPMAESSPPT